MVTGATIDQAVFARGCSETMSRYQELLDVRDRMPSMTVEENAKYADLVIRTYGGDEEFVTQQLTSMTKRPQPPPADITASSIGALAYFSLYAPTENLRNTAFEAYKRYNTPSSSLLSRYCLIM